MGEFLMYVVSRVMSFQTGTAAAFLDRLTKPSLVNEFPGFIRKEVWFREQAADYDLVRLNIYWTSKDAHLAWERSPQHIAQHRAQVGQPRPFGLIETRHESYNHVDHEG